ncbi:hypothetical protein HHK36_025586 [Tetracentron sinense]|uniref:Meiotic nuclear division protein 1 homolog n=1 Tax=Tetracentron sinense TaxID=13715 RepID=A0A834YLJ9_TETSI|nr:hypothetical protein HHK36_025586 [Tetracentron sinense]
MSKKRGLSLEEKHEKMLQIFYDSQDFFLLKELEKLGPKKGVISQSVKDVVQSLVDDDLVSKDKIGTSVYFWSLPSCAGNQLRNVYHKLESDLESSKKRLAELDELEEALCELKAIELKYYELKDEMGRYADNDPAALEALRQLCTLWPSLFPDYCMETTPQTTSSHCGSGVQTVFLRPKCSLSICTRRKEIDNSHMHRCALQVGITDDFDYLELSTMVPPNPVGDQILEDD